MARKKSKEQIQYNMSRVRNSDTALEKLLCEELNRHGVTTFTRNNKTIFGKPDIAFIARKIAVFCDGDFWHGYDWENAQNEIKSNRDFWIPKIERNMQRDQEVTARLQEQGWVVLRFWGHEILKEMDYCISTILDELRALPQPPYRTIDLCAGIGGIRRGFELTGQFQNVLSSEIDKYACRTYQHLFGDDPQHDLTSDEFKQLVADEVSLGFGFFGQRNETKIHAQPCGSVQTVGRGFGESRRQTGCKIRIRSSEEYPGM